MICKHCKKPIPIRENFTYNERCENCWVEINPSTSNCLYIPKSINDRRQKTDKGYSVIFNDPSLGINIGE